MSREFGEYGGGGYFHNKIQDALDDLRNEASEEFHKEFIPLFEELYQIAYAISSVEACDSCIDRSIFRTMESLPAIKKWVEHMDKTLEPYKRVAREAVADKAKRKLIK